MLPWEDGVTINAPRPTASQLHMHAMKHRLFRYLQSSRSVRRKDARFLKNFIAMSTLPVQSKQKKKPKYGAEEFERYANQIVGHPNYAGMPDLYGNKGTIQWEAPSNRSTGKFKDTHHLRRDWWRKKAASLSINPITEKSWISKVAKAIHPFGKKPCKSCGNWMSLSYCYPSKLLISRLERLDYIPASVAINSLSDIRDVIPAIAKATANRILDDLPTVLASKSMTIPNYGRNLDAWMEFISNTYIPSEPSLLSPGAMSNAPDRLDGFHSFNRCCRERADTGRTKENLASYVTDRRAFEYWVDGDWIAADRLMGQVRSNKVLHQEKCFNSNQPGAHPQPCQADHIGPISLGFAHRPQFQFLCRSCNSAKNNRMYATDVSLLLQAEAKGENVISWFAAPVWDILKYRAIDDESALRLSKVLRDNRHAYMKILNGLYSAGHFAYLACLLHLKNAERVCTFVNLRAENHLTKFDRIESIQRDTKYTTEQKARRISIGFNSLRDYFKKENRNAFVADPDVVSMAIHDCDALLSESQADIASLNQTLAEALRHDKDSDLMRDAATAVDAYCATGPDVFLKVTERIQAAMLSLAGTLSNQWDDDRYARAEGFYTSPE